jgi:hypothetical protein
MWIFLYKIVMENKIGKIYKITNNINGKLYIGQISIEGKYKKLIEYRDNYVKNNNNDNNNPQPSPKKDAV